MRTAVVGAFADIEGQERQGGGPAKCRQHMSRQGSGDQRPACHYKQAQHNAFAAARDPHLCQGIIAGRPPGVVPSGLVQRSVCLLVSPALLASWAYAQEQQSRSNEASAFFTCGSRQVCVVCHGPLLLWQVCAGHSNPAAHCSQFQMRASRRRNAAYASWQTHQDQQCSMCPVALPALATASRPAAQHARLPLECQSKVIVRLSIGWVWVAGSQAVHRRPQVSLSLVPLATPQVPLQS